jgi:two-component SAPR family response regulator
MRPTAVFTRVLGTVEVEGAGEFRRAKSRELVVYLAMHPCGVGEAELDEAMWPSDRGRVVAAATRDSTVSVARTAVGGPDRLLPAQGQGREKRYQLGPDVGSDWATFCALSRQARGSGEVDPLRQALELVRGRPFEGAVSGRSYGWIHTEGHGRHIEAEVVDAADLAAGMYLEEGRPLDARWSARQGLTADPLAERLWVRLMQAADALGESLEIERIMDEMDVILELGGDFSGLHPNTLRAYDRLSRRRHGGHERASRSHPN